MKQIHLWGLKQNNLKNLDLKIPHGAFIVICGPSGSGKSSLAFETLYAEGQRRYIESLSNYAKQYLNKAPKPDVEGVKNLPPAVAIEQKNTVKTSRSTVGTTTEVSDYIRLLFEKLGTPHCPKHKIPVERESVSVATDRALEKFNGLRGYVLAPINEKSRIENGKKLHALLLKEGLLRALNDKNEVIELDNPATVKKGLPKQDFWIVIDRLSFSNDDRGRIADSVGQAYTVSTRLNHGFAGGHCKILTTDNQFLQVSEENSCSLCGYTFPTISSALFSFNSPIGACTECNGFGNILTIDEDKIVPNPKLTLAQGAIHPFTMPSTGSDRKALFDFCKKRRINLHTPWADLTNEERTLVWNGSDRFDGVKGLFDYLETKKYKMHVRVFLSRYKSTMLCSTCKGSRLNSFVEHILLSGKSISQVSQMTLRDCLVFIKNITLTKMQKEIAGELLKQIISRLEFLVDVGVHYLTLDRPTRTLSGGEYQRLILANQLGMALSQTLYVLDEPTIGLHPRDTNKLIELLKKLNAIGNTVVIVEHDKDVIKSSEHIIEMGPGSGHLGGEVIFNGESKDFLLYAKSNTSTYLNPKPNWQPLRINRPTSLKDFQYLINIKGCSGNNLQNVSVSFPLNRLVSVTGVSGSGKSTLITQTLYPAIARELGIEFTKAQPYKSLTGFEYIKNVLLIDQTPIGRTSRSSPVTYLKIYDSIREVMASVPEAKVLGYTASTFSLNVDGGRCPVCKGAGSEIIDMMFMDDVEIKCEACDGKKFRPEILDIKYRGKHIHNILNLTVTEAMDFFVAHPNIRRSLSTLKEVGLEYIRLGQSANSLSGGESQRLKLAREFNSVNQKNTLYILDEPTTGLHFREVELLLKVLHKLIDSGGSILVIEHNLDVIAASDYCIDLGPEAGLEGGKVVFQGPTPKITSCKDSHTGKALKQFIEEMNPALLRKNRKSPALDKQKDQ
ncbi:MAG: excinuclease ABC subunit A [Proteobacteria bacterium SG_bin7]|nr:MAG: excinuclease ABC subunit A [Proteobacteria bacterium SG_bin7]